MAHDLPGERKLLLTWGVLMGLTLVSLVGGQVVGEGRAEPLAWWSVALVLGATYYKARQILMVYLNLRASTPGWKGLLRAFLVLTLGLILGGYLLAVLA
ncbi:MAG: cytochrome C oxidase subunit IV family protein [Ectothiorhodospiraceae bacterium]|nr:cytochrome C oxidase subunit IV family protein [Ectothiorhodospiraceae bacterium]